MAGFFDALFRRYDVIAERLSPSPSRTRADPDPAAHLLYLDTKNVLFAWRARRVARQQGLATPEWVERVFDEIGGRLADMLLDVDTENWELTDAIGLSKGGGARYVKQSQWAERRLECVGRANRHQWHDVIRWAFYEVRPRSLGQIYASLATFEDEDHEELGTFENWFYKYTRPIPCPPGMPRLRMLKTCPCYPRAVMMALP